MFHTQFFDRPYYLFIDPGKPFPGCVGAKIRFFLGTTKSTNGHKEIISILVVLSELSSQTMNSPEIFTAAHWPFWRKLAFRFFTLFFLLQLAPWTWLDFTGHISTYYYRLTDWIVQAGNRYLFHVKDVLVPMGGSGDTSMGWAQLWTFLFLAAIGCLIWSALDRRRPNYETADYWVRNMVRYFVAMNALGYGIWKLYANQMPFPNLSLLATPLGDFLPMRLSWMFMGYSAPYQIFAGVMETVAGLLLLNRRTVTLGLCLSAGVFANVAMMNLSYDIPVKIFSMQLLFYCLYLLAHESRRLLDFFVLNRPTAPNTLFAYRLPKKWMRIGRIVLKAAFIVATVILPFRQSLSNYQRVSALADLPPIQSGVYDVTTYVVNRDTIPYSPTDSLRWRDMIFEKGGLGSVGSVDTLFRQRYRRGYFTYAPDTAKQVIHLTKMMGDTTPLMTLRYEMPNPKTIRLWSLLRGDSLYVELVRSNRHFQLAERQFHWLSEANR